MFEGQWNAFLCLCVCSVKAVVMIVRYYIRMTTVVKLVEQTHQNADFCSKG